MVDAKEIMLRAAMIGEWTVQKQLDLAMEFINSVGAGKALVDFLVEHTIEQPTPQPKNPGAAWPFPTKE